MISQNCIFTLSLRGRNYFKLVTTIGREKEEA